MKKQDWLQVIIIGLGLSQISRILPLLISTTLFSMRIEEFTSYFIIIFIWVLLIFQNRKVAFLLLPADENSSEVEEKINWRRNDILELVVIALGINLIITILPQMVSYLVRYIIPTPEGEIVPTTIYLRLVIRIITLAFGLFLIICTRSIARIILSISRLSSEGSTPESGANNQ